MKKTILLFSGILLIFITSCKHPCYNRALEIDYTPDFCTMDCPGVCGCDGNTYCNSCMAHKSGYEVKHNGPCP